MSLTATVVDPLTGPPPSGWDQFVAAQRLPPGWYADLITAMDWCATAPSSMALVHDRAGAPVAAFHARHLGPGRPWRFSTPGRAPVAGLTACVTPPPANDAGIAFAAGTDGHDRREAVRVFERAVRRRARLVRPARPLIGYRGLYEDDLRAVPTGRRITFRLSPQMALTNEWPDVTSYLRSLTKKFRYQVRKVRETVDADRTLRVDPDGAVDPVEACWLAEVVRRRYASRWLPSPPLPTCYFARMARLPGTRLVTYRDGRGRLLAYLALYDDGRDLAMVCWGSRATADGRRTDVYFDQYLRLVDLMIGSGRQRLLMGRGMEQIKGRYGARPLPRWGVVGLA
jgi:hypothetical protein